MRLSRNDLNKKYGLSEATLVRLEAEEGSALDAAESKVVRGKIVYEVDDELDMYLRCAAAYYTQLPGPLLPCHRAFLFTMISEVELNEALRMLRERGLVPHAFPNKVLVRYWKQFLDKVPIECMPYITGKTDEVNGMTEMLLKMLGVAGPLADPDVIISKYGYLTEPPLRVLIDGLLAVEATVDVVKEYMLKAHRVESTLDSLREYRFYCFDMKICGQEGAVLMAKYAADPLYRECVSSALYDGSPSEVIGCLKLSALIDMRTEVDYALRNKRRILTTSPTREVGVRAQQTAVKEFQAMYLMVNTVEKTVDSKDNTDDLMDLLKLKHNAQINKQQLTLKDLPKGMHDDVESGPIKRDTTG